MSVVRKLTALSKVFNKSHTSNQLVSKTQKAYHFRKTLPSLLRHKQTNSGGKDKENKGELKKIFMAVLVGLSAYYKLHNPTLNALSDKQQSRREKYNFIADIVEDVSPTVVNIERTYLGKNGKPVISTGSGFIVDQDGLIITNAHVIGNQSKVKIRLLDGRTFEGQVAAVDESRDIAALRINTDGSSLQKLDFCPLSELRVGEWVMAIGSPLALKNSVTVGIISNLRRPGKELGLTDNKSDIGYIQTDAIINVGNSGGPLVNLAGKMVGMNTMMASAGIAFAIPTSTIKYFLNKIKSGDLIGHWAKRWLGLHVYSLNKDIVEQIRLGNPNYSINVDRGLFVATVEINSPAYLGGLRKNDIITKVNGNLVETPKDMYEILNKKEELELSVLRNGEKITIKVIGLEMDSKV